MSEAEKEELAVRKRREEGTPVNDSTFADWWARFQQEQEQAIAEEGASEKTIFPFPCSGNRTNN